MEVAQTKPNPRILVVIPTLGQRTSYLRQTLESVTNQAPIKFDTILVCPLDNPETLKLAKEFGATMIDDPKGISAAVNAGIAQAKPGHEFISWIGDDDLLTPGSFATAISALDNEPRGVLAYGYCDYIDDKGRRLFTSKAGKFAPWIMTWGPNLVPLPGMLFRLSALKKAGKFDTFNKYSMDLDMLLRIRKHGKLINTHETLASFRWHATSTTVANRDRVLRETEFVKRKYLPKYLQVVAPMWELPVRVATKIAAKRVNKMASN